VSAKKQPKNAKPIKGKKAAKKATSAAPASGAAPKSSSATKTAAPPKPSKADAPVELAWACEAGGSKEGRSPKDRFYAGLIAGISGALMVAIVIGGITAEVMSQRAADAARIASEEASSGPMLGLDKNGRGTLTGWIELSGLAEKSVDATAKPDDVVGGLGLYGSATEASITVDTFVQPLISRAATITREGKPYNPPGDAKNSAAWRFLSVLLDEDSFLNTEEHTATIRVHKTDQGLITDSVDIGPVIAQPAGEDTEIEIP
jgi:hypothetical protein